MGRRESLFVAVRGERLLRAGLRFRGNVRRPEHLEADVCQKAQAFCGSYVTRREIETAQDDLAEVLECALQETFGAPVPFVKANAV